MNRDEPVNSTLILVLGILSLVICPLLGPLAWSMGTTALRNLSTYGDFGPQRSIVTAGRVCGIASSLLFLAYLVFVLWERNTSHVRP